MIRRIFAGLAGMAALSLVPQPIAAQAGADSHSATGHSASAHSESGDAAMDQTMAMLGKMFPAEPLTPEQEARLPQAQRIINRMIPDGTLGEMMGGMMDQLLGPMMDAAGGPAIAAVTKGTGLQADTLGLSPEQTEELAALFDPAYAERHKRETALMPAFMRDMMAKMEPSMRKAMSELYAVHFSQTELDDIEAFFKTDSGTAYARKSFTMSSDPRIVAASMEALPEMMGAIAGLEEKMAAASAGLPVKRDFNALSKAEQARVAALTGYSIAEIKDQISAGMEP